MMINGKSKSRSSLDNHCIVSPKSFYRFVEFISKLCGGSLPHGRYKKIALDLFNAESKEEIEAKTLSDAFSYIISNVHQSFSNSIIKNTYYLLTGIVLEDPTTDYLLDMFYRNINADPLNRVIFAQRIVLKNIKARRIEFAFLLSNYIMLKSDKHLLIPYPHTFDEYKLNLKIDDYDKWLLLLKEMEEKPHDEDNAINLTKEQVIELIKPKLELIKSKYKVTFFALYGGFVKGLITSSSDIDFLVSFDSSLLDCEKGEKNRELKEYLASLLNAEVDLINFDHALKNLDISEMENVLIFIKWE